MLHIYNPKFKYVPAAQTDIRKTFERVRAQQEAAKWLVDVQVKHLIDTVKKP